MDQHCKLVSLSSNFLQDLGERDWKVMMTGAEKQVLQPNQLLIEQGKQNTKLIKCVKGKLRVEKGTLGGQKHVLAELE